jgi:hypothetical protein
LPALLAPLLKPLLVNLLKPLKPLLLAAHGDFGFILRLKLD